MQRRVSGYILDAGVGERLEFAGVVVVVKASGETTGGAFAVLEEIDPVDTPLHVHAHEDELFYVIEGEHVFQVGDEEYHAGPGAVVLGRGTWRTRTGASYPGPAGSSPWSRRPSSWASSGS